ncbi:prenyltransferase/squalene oxidase repeat-containing protein [Stieleria varia]|uniref:Prenyltransferase and squalene oxidase repeat protein n=1 Tax=Stieleria varia TaxID=2528005 RepID=A0A5C6B757_9BACT|nr:prenyltransferase/squalene oxidase repeat-containing protein [Stieleria varia]TWU07740.1 hypothetical protein Pla52n_03130 [Stieleria varia]
MTQRFRHSAATIGSRRRFLSNLFAVACASGVSLGLPRPARGIDDFESLYVDDEIDKAVRKAVSFLFASQQKNGSIADQGNVIAMTSLSIMAMASIGIEPDVGTENGRAMQRALDYVLLEPHQTKDGYFGQNDSSRMYGHGIVTLMLTEMLGMGATSEQNALIHERLEKALKLIIESQKVRKEPQMKGGWRYHPTSTDADLSVSVWQVMALRSAKNDGMAIPTTAIDMALQYLRNSYSTGRRRRENVGDDVGGFSYMPGQQQPTFAMTAAGLLAMQVCGQYEADEVKGAAEWLLDNPPKQNERYFSYGLYYYAQGMHQAGGKYAEEAERNTADLLMRSQRANGSWLSPNREESNFGYVYATTLAVLSLSVRYHYLPIYQR